MQINTNKTRTCLLIFHSSPTDRPCIIRGVSTGYSKITHEWCMDYPWTIHGLSMDHRMAYQSVDNPKTSKHGFGDLFACVGSFL